MASQDKNALESKLAFYEHLDLFGQDDTDDELDEEEIESRRRHRQFFLSRSLPSTTAAHSSPSKSTNNAKRRTSPSKLSKSVKRQRKNLDDAAPIDLSSPPTERIIEDTPAGNPASKGRAPDVSSYPEISIVKETPIARITDPTRRFIRHVETTTPAPVGKRSAARHRLTTGATAVGSTDKKIRQPKLTGKTAKTRPEEEQILRGLEFYYIPDNDIAPARKIRITKAKEFGAVWTRDVTTATHVVAEKDLTYEDVEKVLSRAEGAATATAFASEKLHVVNEEYPLDCIQFRSVLDPAQRKYLLKGQPQPEKRGGHKATEDAPGHGQPRISEHVSRNGRDQDAEEPMEMIVAAPTTKSLEIKPRRSKVPPPPENTPPENRDQSQNERSYTQDGFRQQQKMGPDCDRSSDPRDDELSEYINLMQEFKHLPLDDGIDDNNDEDDGKLTSKPAVDPAQEASAAESGSDEQQQQQQQEQQSQKKQRPKTRSHQKNLKFEERFACNSAGSKDANVENPNSRTIQVLSQMLRYYERIMDQWRVNSYRKAIATLKRQKARITTEDEAFHLPNIGRSLAQKIEEIVTTDRLQRFEYAQKETTDETLQLFLGIYGVGTGQAQQWIAQGHRSLEDLKETAKLSPNQLIGIEHYDDINSRIPRAEVEALAAVVKSAARKMDPSLEVITGGSYRRGSDSSGDIDLIVTKPGTTATTELLPTLRRLIEHLEAQSFLVARLASSRRTMDGSKWHGCCVLPQPADRRNCNDGNFCPIWRRIDFLLVPESELGAALIYFTGNDIFNRSLRLLASRKKMRLNQRGLYKDTLRGPERTRGSEGELLEARSERKIFELLGVKWREPHERWC